MKINEIAKQMVSKGKGILAADESTGGGGAGGSSGKNSKGKEKAMQGKKSKSRMND